MICTCQRCLYTFQAEIQPDQCPDCGKFAVRPATVRESVEFQRIQREIQAEPTWYRPAPPRTALGHT